MWGWKGTGVAIYWEEEEARNGERVQGPELEVGPI